MKTYENKNNLDKLLENVMRFATYFMMVDDYKNVIVKTKPNPEEWFQSPYPILVCQNDI